MVTLTKVSNIEVWRTVARPRVLERLAQLPLNKTPPVTIHRQFTYDGLKVQELPWHWMICIPLLAAELNYPEILGLHAPLPTMVLNNIDDPLFTPAEMAKANTILQEIYAKARAGDRYNSRFYPGLHKFDIKMQTTAFDWFDRWLQINPTNSEE